MKIETTGNFNSTINKIEQKEIMFSDFLLKTALLLNSKIQRRVQSKGLGSNDSPLKKYSRIYSFRKERTGRQTGFRDLTFTGNMWQSLTAEVVGNKRVEMLFGGAEEKAKAFFNDEKTPFFSLSPSEKAFLQKELEGFAKI